MRISVILLTSWPLGMTDEVASVVIPTMASLIVFALGWCFTFFYNLCNNRKRIILYRNAVFEWSNLVVGAVQKQINSLEDLGNRLEKTHSLYPEKYEFSRSMADKLSDLSAERVFKMFIANSHIKEEDKRARQAFNLISQYDYLASIESNVKEIYDAYHKQAVELQDLWNNLLIELQHAIDAETSKTPRELQVYTLLQSSINNYMQSPVQKELIQIVYQQFITPLNIAVDQCKKEYPEVKNYLSAYECARKMDLVYKQWFALTRGYAAVFNNTALNISASLNTLIQAVDYFKYSTNVCFWVK